MTDFENAMVRAKALELAMVSMPGDDYTWTKEAGKIYQWLINGIPELEKNKGPKLVTKPISSDTCVNKY